MPSEFETMMTASLPGTHYAILGQTASYTGPDNTSAVLTVRVQKDDPRQVERANGAVGEVQTGRVMCMASDLAKPIKGGRFTIDGLEVWTIEATPRLANGQHVCSCIRTGVNAMMPRRAKE